MKFYERILQELKSEEHSFQTIYKHAFSFSDHVYFEESSNLRIERTTYAQARQATLKIAAALRKQVQPGQIVALMLPNSPLWVECFWAMLQAGCKPLLLSPLMPARVAARCLAHTGCTMLLGDMTLEGCRTIPAAELDKYRHDAEEAPEIMEGWGDEIILATSSTTGEPKLLAFNGKAICIQILNSKGILETCKEVARFDHGVIRMLAFLPFTHIFGLTACFLWFTMFGVTFVFLKNLQPDTILRTCRLHRVTHVFAVPLLWDTMTARILKTVEEKGLTDKFQKLTRISLKLQDAAPTLGQLFARCVFSSVHKQTLGSTIKYCISGGGMLSKETLPLLNAIGYPLENGNGMTEIGIASLSNKKASQRQGLGVGKPMTSLEFMLDENGQLLVRGSSCYTARYMDGKRLPSNPNTWFATGDIFTVDEQGEYSFISRMDDLVNGANGERLSPDEIENQMALTLEHCVFGLENGILALMLRLPEQCYISDAAWKHELDAVRAAIDQLPTYMRPRQIYISRQPLPLSLSGKIRRQAIRQGVIDGSYPCDSLAALQQSGAQQSRANDALLQTLRELFSKHAPSEQSVSDGSHFFVDLGGDSLCFLELISEIETKFDVRISNEMSAEMTTPAAAARQITACLEAKQ